MTERGERTKKRLLDAAELLFAERGVDGVSLREINAAAGERNNAALYYHFRDRAGLVSAIVERHHPRLMGRQHALFERAEREGRLTDLRTLVEILVRPAAEDLKAGASERAWLRISCELLTRPQTESEQISTGVSRAAYNAGARIVEHLTQECALPREFAVQRVVTVTEGVAFMLASRARYEDAPERRRPAPPIDLYIEDILDITCAALEAPMSDHAARLAEASPSTQTRSALQE